MTLSELKSLCEHKARFFYSEDMITPKTMLVLIEIVEQQEAALNEIANMQGALYVAAGCSNLRGIARSASFQSKRALGALERAKRVELGSEPTDDA